ncbi:MAG: DNA-primase RepB domain-containing protein [Microscillaceae bacterium]|nr:DNA-primase RepB domain-containing protein [Microscillaceae bacterium]
MNHHTKTETLIQNYLFALEAAEYDVRLVPVDKESDPPIKRKYSPEQMLKSIKFFKAKNVEGYHIYARPLGWEYILVDDLSRENLKLLKVFKPCLLIETSPENYQAWLRLAEVPEDRESAKAICQALARHLGADPGSAEPDHVGRLPGFTNRKPQYQDEKGLYPYVKLHKYARRLSSISPEKGIVAQKAGPIPIQKPKRSKDRDRSREDFNLVCMLIRQGKSDEYIREQLMLKSEKATEINPSWDYIGKTIRNARRILNK